MFLVYSVVTLCLCCRTMVDILVQQMTEEMGG